MRRERLYLEDILAAADAIREFIRGQDYGSFEASPLLRSAVVHPLTIIGEAVGHIPAELRERYPAIPWTDITDSRRIG